jgi:hypothetical protein
VWWRLRWRRLQRLRCWWLLTDPRCRSARLCAGRTKDGPAITAKPDTVCSACVLELQRQLEELPHLATALHVFMAVTPKTAMQSRVSSTPEPSCPVDARVDELLVDIGDTIDRCDGLKVIDLIHQPAMKFYVWFRDQRRERFLDGCDRALAIRAVHVRANKILGFDRLKLRRVAPCPQCSLPTLYTYVGEDTVVCGDEECGLVLSLADYEAHCIELSTNNQKDRHG